MDTSTASLGTIVGVWAHPDDEAYLTAGLMALARRNRQRVLVVTATLGERGSADPDRWPPHRLGRRRRREMARSLAAVGVHEHQWLDWPDGGCDVVPTDVGAGQIESVLRAVEPDTVVTFGPDGMTGHPDHRAVSAWTTAAWDASGRRSRLLYATVTPEFHDEWGALNDRVGMWMDPVGRPCTPRPSLALEVSCHGEILERKMAALRAHASQTTGLIDMVGQATYREWWATEWFVDATRALGVAASRSSPATSVTS